MSVCLNSRMPLCILFLAAMATPASQAAEENKPLTLSQASARLMQNNPQLQLFNYRFRALKGLQQSADQAPALTAGVEAANLLGSGDYVATDSAEYTVSLSSVFELGDKRQARTAEATSRYQLAEAERENAAVDLLADLTRSFITALTLQQKRQLAAENTALARTSATLVERRVSRGAAPLAEQLRANAALVQAQMQEQYLATELSSQLHSLAALLGQPRADFSAVSGDLFDLPDGQNFAQLNQQLADSATLNTLRVEERLRDAELQLIRARSAADIQWGIGLTQFSATSDTAFSASISIPLFSSSRSLGEVQSAQAQQAATAAQQQNTLISLQSRLYQAWQQRQQDIASVQGMTEKVIPALQQALDETRNAYQLGRYSYSEWISARQELMNARLIRINAASNALLNQALIEQLTGLPLTPADSQ